MGAVATNASCGSFNDNDSNMKIITFWEMPFVNCRDTPQAIPEYPLSNFYLTAVALRAKSSKCTLRVISGLSKN